MSSAPERLRLVFEKNGRYRLLDDNDHNVFDDLRQYGILVESIRVIVNAGELPHFIASLGLLGTNIEIDVGEGSPEFVTAYAREKFKEQERRNRASESKRGGSARALDLGDEE